ASSSWRGTGRGRGRARYGLDERQEGGGAGQRPPVPAPRSSRPHAKKERRSTCDEGATMKLEGKRILITGGGSGMGLELARRLADRNKVVIAGRDLAKLERARGDTSALQTRQLDVTS